jgi:signal transduction histidine kinase
VDAPSDQLPVRPSRLTTGGWFGAALVVVGLVFGVLSVFGALQLNSAASTSDQLSRHILPASATAERFKAALVDQETGLRGYLLGRREEFLEPYVNGLATERAAADSIRNLLKGDRLLADLDEIEVLVGSWRRAYAEPFIQATRQGGTVSAAQVVQSRNAFDRIRAGLAAQERGLARAQTVAYANLDDARSRRDLIFMILLAAFLLTALIIALLVRYAVLRPLSRLGEAARLVASGEFDRTIDISGPRDLVQLGADVESMRGRIAHELTVIREAQVRLQTQADLLEEQAVTLRRSNAELEQFVYVASHDLQEPLRKVASFCQMLERRYADRLDDRGREYIGFAVDGAKRMQTLINELLTYSRIGRLHDERRPVDLNRTLDRALSALSRQVPDVARMVERPDLPEVVGDPTLLAMLWRNLLDNAVKFRSPDRPPKVRIDAGRVAGSWEFSISDTGIGVEARYAEKIFVIFQRLHPRDAYEGTGIGLALCKKIVEHHGGQITLDTAYEGGARFVFTLPVAEPALDA